MISSSLNRSSIAGDPVENLVDVCKDVMARSADRTEALVMATNAMSESFGTIAQEVVTFVEHSFMESMAKAKALTEVNTPDEFLQLQTGWVKSASDAYIAHMARLAGLATAASRPIQTFVLETRDQYWTNET